MTLSETAKAAMRQVLRELLFEAVVEFHDDIEGTPR